VTIETMLLQKWLGKVLEPFLDGRAGYVGFGRPGCRGEQNHDRHRKGEGQVVHARTSLSGPLPESNFLANCSLMLNRSPWTPADRRMVV